MKGVSCLKVFCFVLLEMHCFLGALENHLLEMLLHVGKLFFSLAGLWFCTSSDSEMHLLEGRCLPVGSFAFVLLSLKNGDRFKAAYDTLQATLKHYIGCQDLNCEQSCKALLLEDLLVTFLFFASKKFQRLGPFQ